MRTKRGPSREVYAALSLQKLPRPKRRRRLFLAILAAAGAFALCCGLFLRRLSSEIAMSDAVDAVTLAVSDCVSQVLREQDYSEDWFVTISRDESGNITALTTNTAHINALSTELQQKIARSADNQCLNIRIPLGNLLGSNLLLGRGPEIPVEILMLTSSFVRFDNDLVSTGINQSRHIVTLRAEVDVDILIPWGTLSTTVESEIPIAETVIVGRVPETYVNITEANDGYK